MMLCTIFAPGDQPARPGDQPLSSRAGSRGGPELIGAAGRSQRSQIMFMDREDILNLYTVTNLPIPGEGAKAALDDDIPF